MVDIQDQEKDIVKSNAMPTAARTKLGFVRRNLDNALGARLFGELHVVIWFVVDIVTIDENQCLVKLLQLLSISRLLFFLNRQAVTLLG